MKNLILILVMMSAGVSVFACTNETINSITKPIDPYYNDTVGSQTESAISTLALCDENLNYAGFQLAMRFDPYYAGSVADMVAAIVRQRTSLPHELINGLGLGLIQKLDLYYYNSTFQMLTGLLRIAEAAPEFSKTFALQLLQKQDAYQANANRLVLQAVTALRNLAVQPNPSPDPVASPIWAFRSNNAPCDGITGPWGNYELCPRYYASVADQYGNRLVLACKAENAGVEFRVTFSREKWAKISATQIETLAFGTSNTLQSLGTPYQVNQAATLLAQEPMAFEVLNELRSANSLIVNVRSNSGEVNTKLNFSLKGSNIAIGQLLQVCR